MTGTVEATASLVRYGDEWRIQFDFDSGESMQSDQTFDSRERAQAALDAWSAQNATKVYPYQ